MRYMRKMISTLLALVMLLSAMGIAEEAAEAMSFEVPEEAVEEPESLPEEEDSEEAPIPEPTVAPIPEITEAPAQEPSEEFSELPVEEAAGEIFSEESAPETSQLPTLEPTGEPESTAEPLPADLLAAELGLTVEQLAVKLGMSVEELYLLDEETLRLQYARKKAADDGFKIDENGVLTKYSGRRTYVDIPDFVTAIGDEAFYSNEIDIYHNDPLYSVNIPGSVKSIGKRAFARRENLTSVTMEYGIESIGEEAFYMTDIESITLPDSVTNLGKGAFYLCTELTSVKLSESLTSIGSTAFSYCSIHTVEFPASVTRLENSAFSNCSLTSITIPSTLKYVGAWAFNECVKLSEVEIENGVETIGRGAFYTCTALTSIHIPSSVKSISDSAFAYCNNLRSVILEDGLEFIGWQSFYQCDRLRRIIIPGSVKEIGYEAFVRCYLCDVEIMNGVETISDYAFSENNLAKITIPESVRSIGFGAFRENKSLGSAYIAGDNLEIDEYAFDCCGLKYVELKEGVTALNSYVFSECTGCEIHLPKSLNYIHDVAFEDCSCTLVVKSGSYAQKFAKNHHLSYKVSGKTPGTIRFRGVQNGDVIPIDYYKLRWNAVSGTKYYKVAWTFGIFDGQSSIKVKDNACVIQCEEMGVECNIWVGAYSSKNLLLAQNSIWLFAEDLELPHSIHLDESSITLGVGDWYDFEPQVEPDDADDWYFYTSSKPQVADFEDERDRDCLVARKPGVTTITVETINGKTAKCKVTVKKDPTWVKLDQSELALSVGQGAKLKASMPKGAASKLLWETSDWEVVELDDGEGALTAVGEGTATISVKTSTYDEDNPNSNLIARCTVTVLPEPTELLLPESAIALGKGEKYTLRPEVVADDGASVSSYSFYSDNEAVAKVDGSGQITAGEGGGAAKITVRAHNYEADKPELEKICMVTVVNAPKKVTLSEKKKTLGVGDEFELTAKLPDGTASQLTASASGKGIVTLKEIEPGRYSIKAEKKGSATIAIKTFNKKKATCKITVKEAPASATLSQSAAELGVGETASLKVSFAPAKSFANVIWTSDNAEVVDVVDGKLTAKFEGSATVTAKVLNRPDMICEVSVKAAPTAQNAKLSPESPTILVKAKQQLSVSYAGAAGAVKSWKSSKKAIATVSKTGLVTGKKAGTATITATLYNGIKITTVVTVTK